MFNTEIKEHTERQTKRYTSGRVTFPDKPQNDYKVRDYASIINKTMFAGLTVVAVVLFYIAISSLML